MIRSKRDRFNDKILLTHKTIQINIYMFKFQTSPTSLVRNSPCPFALHLDICLKMIHRTHCFSENSALLLGKHTFQRDVSYIRNIRILSHQF
jgi:hypothetical protein